LRFRSNKRIREWLAGRLAAKQAVEQLQKSRRQSCRLVTIEITYDYQGAPFLPGMPELSVSVSHSGDMAVAVAMDGKIGIDLEFLPNISRDLMTHFFFSENEMIEINASAEEGKDKRALLLWTQKEAVSKLLGVGGQIAFKKIDTSASTFKFLSSFTDNYCFSIAI
jgi:phosphopantetheinyl transferase